MGLDVGRERAVTIQFRLRELDERLGIEPRSGIRRAGWHGVEDVFRLLQQRRTHRAEGFDAEREELRRSAAREHLHEQQQLAVLRLQQVRHGRILDVAHRDVGESGGGDLGFVGERAIREHRRAAGLPEGLALIREVDRCDLEQEPEARRDVGQRAVDGEVGTESAGRGHVGAEHRSSSASAGTTAASA